MCDSLRERLATRGLQKVIIIQNTRRQIEGKPVTMDVRNFFVNPQNEELQNIVRQWKHLSASKKLFAIQLWVTNNIKYKPDHGEFWQLPFETLTLGTGDCDDIAVLTANLMLAAGFKYYDVMLNVADVPSDFHAFAMYKAVVVDPLFPHVKSIPENWKICFLWNAKSAYTLKGNIK